MCGGVESRVFFQIIFFVGPVNFLLVLSNFRSKPFGKGFCWSRQFFARSPLIGERERASKQWEANFSFSLLVFLGLKYPLHTKTYERKSCEQY